MTYEDTINYLYTQIPMFQKVGSSAYKPGLQTSITLDNALGNPHSSYKTIHVAGTNGKGSVSHLIAAILQQSGYRVGLYTSPHLVDFRERIRVNGQKISKEFVTDFVDKYKAQFEPLHPSFFELTSTMAFDYFRDQKVEIAVIETGLGGRLDSTNIISPILSIITNISLDHVQYLGDSLEMIAFEKSGIIKENTPALIGEVINEAVGRVFKEKAEEVKAPLFFAEKQQTISNPKHDINGRWTFDTDRYGSITDQLGGMVQLRNAQTVIAALSILESIGIEINAEGVKEGFAYVTELTGLMGRWQTLQTDPTVICDTGHNVGGWEYLSKQLSNRKASKLHMVVGMVNDKDINGVLRLMPKDAIYYFTQASIQRALPAKEFATLASNFGLEGDTFESVADAVKSALEVANINDMIFIGGSTFIVADALPLFINEPDCNNLIK